MADLVIHRYGNPNGRLMVVVHGLTEAGTTWPDLVARWGSQWDLVAPDLRGHGASPRFKEHELASAIELMLADVIDLLEAQPKPVVLLGHSLGGLLALRAAIARPRLVSTLVLEDPARPSGDPHPAQVFVAETEAFLDSMASEADRAWQVDRIVRETSWSHTESIAWAQCKPRVDREYVRKGLRLGAGVWEELFTELTMPTLLVLPPDSPMAPRLDPAANHAVRTVVIPGAGHNVRRDRPAAFYNAIEEFIGSVK